MSLENQVLMDHIHDLAMWIDAVKFRSGDPFALQCSDLGVTVGKIHPMGVGAVFSRIDQKFPWVSNALVPHKVAPISLGLYAQSCWIMYRITGERMWLKLYSDTVDSLTFKANEDFRKKNLYVWGIPFKWLMGTGTLAPENTPMSTVSPYCSDAFYISGRYETATSSAEFIIRHLNHVHETDSQLALSYSPIDNYCIINVQAYCAAQLYRAYVHTGYQIYKNPADKLIKYVLSEQNEDGSWCYWGSQQPILRTIDSLHQCYIMQGLYRCYMTSMDEEIRRAVMKCMSYCKEHLITNDLQVNKFPSDTAPYRKHPYELMDAAEMVATLNMVGDPLGKQLLRSTIEKFKHGRYFASWLNPRNNIPYIRWGESQMLFAMAQCLAVKTRKMTLQEIYL